VMGARVGRVLLVDVGCAMVLCFSLYSVAICDAAHISEAGSGRSWHIHGSCTVLSHASSPLLHIHWSRVPCAPGNN
jgi:hypothetical protein